MSLYSLRSGRLARFALAIGLAAGLPAIVAPTQAVAQSVAMSITAIGAYLD